MLRRCKFDYSLSDMGVGDPIYLSPLIHWEFSIFIGADIGDELKQSDTKDSNMVIHVQLSDDVFC